MTLHDATRAQVRAANPGVSTWVTANAGSGKTRVLTDRVARLLLNGTEPQKILCLTYTKAAASNMQNQLFARLGEWAMLSDGKLSDRLTELGENGATPAELGQARTLFARALETPGGLKIQTIHSFCASLLRRFPLEAGVSPQFQEMDERAGKRLRAEILEDLAEGKTQKKFDAMAINLSGEDADELLQEITGNRTRFIPARSHADIWSGMDLPPGYDEAALLTDALPFWAAEVLPDLRAALLTGSSNDLKAAEKLADIDITRPSIPALRQLEGIFLFASGKTPDQAKIGSFPTKNVRENHPDLMEAVEELMACVETGRVRRRALEAAQKTAALHDFAAVFLPEYARRKQMHGWLDFDDQIQKARDLLTDRTMTAWVLYKLDGGIDHILVDEAQDTSPGQWDVVAKLAEEFTSGQGARDVERTIFVVGDEKQSIYSFQGADTAAFGKMRDHFDQSLSLVNQRLERKELLFSFRSSSAILRLVDAVLQGSNDAAETPALTHRAYYDDLPGRVDVLPFIEKPENEESAPWFEPVDKPAARDPARELAGQIADQIRLILDQKQTVTTSDGLRRVTPGDFLILVQRRSNLFHEIIRALKSRDLAVAGADRLKIGGELAVKDLLALLAFLVTPEDSMSLACALRSPLFRLTEQDLFLLAHGRKGTLWQSLRLHKERHADIFETLNALQNLVDFHRPFELLEAVLTKYEGRKNLIARLGPEAEEGIDALLVQALEYERAEVPSMTGFLGWMDAGEVDIKRQVDSQSDQIRVMTVHGAKGLESPVVILPDTAKRRLQIRGNLVNTESDLTVWKPLATENPPNLKTALETKKRLQDEENQRLLYVALTRAENWLIICGAGDRGKDGESWYNQAESAVRGIGAVSHEFAAGTGLRFEFGAWDGVTDASEDTAPTALSALPSWISTPVSVPVDPDAVLSPSKLGGAKIVAGATEGLDETAAKRRGRQIHSLLEILPQSPEKEWPALARQVLATGSDDGDPGEHDSIFAEASSCLSNPDLAHLFDDTGLAEVGINARLKELDSRRISGIIDRLIVQNDRILAVDFKTNAEVPKTEAEVPEGILRQMGAYLSALKQTFPGSVIEIAILWTRTGKLMPLTQKSVTDALKNTSLP